MEKEIFDRFIKHQLDDHNAAFMDLKAKGMLWNDNLAQTIDLLATKYRSKKQFLYNFTSLHMFVVTLRCNQKCSYCHASSVDEGSESCFDMNFKTARRCVELTFMSPSLNIKIEFQGGEPLLNFEIVKEIVEYAQELNQRAQKHLEFTICTNLLALDQSKLNYIRSKDIYISTSLDGPRDIHDAYRKTRLGGGSYNTVIQNLSQATKELGRDKISALMTVTPYNINKLREVVDEYLTQGLGSIFLRMMNPFGSAYRNWLNLGYAVEDFLKAYRACLEYIIQINLNGIHFPEMFATLLLTRILTPFSTGFVDLQSPAGVGINGVIYDTNGDVYVSDEARMLSKTKEEKNFYLGNANINSWREMFGGNLLREIIAASCIESLPGCAWCVFQPYCGGDPVRNYASFGDMIGNRPQSDFCRKHRDLFNLLFDYLEQKTEDIENVFWSWITCRTLDEIRSPSDSGGSR